jgi:hypothetical protein
MLELFVYWVTLVTVVVLEDSNMHVLLYQLNWPLKWSIQVHPMGHPQEMSEIINAAAGVQKAY